MLHVFSVQRIIFDIWDQPSHMPSLESQTWLIFVELDESEGFILLGRER